MAITPFPPPFEVGIDTPEPPRPPEFGGWRYSHNIDLPYDLPGIDQMADIVLRYGEENVIFAQRFDPHGRPIDDQLSVYIHESARPRNTLRRLANTVFGAFL